MEDKSEDLRVNVSPTDQPPGTGIGLNLSEIEALKDRIEQQKANKLKAEQLVSTLSMIKAREKASRRSPKSTDKKTDDGHSPQPVKRSGTNSSSALIEKSNLLKKKLEEDRAKFESKRGQEDLGRVSQIVEHLRVQLEDQDKTIQQMHSSFKAPQTAEPVLPPEPDIPPEIKQRITDLEMKILDLQENLKEKDSVISARTQAITLLSEDMARKGKNTLDTLDETRSQMQTMQANFVALEDKMNQERAKLKEELEARRMRVQQLEKNYRTAESARFDLSTRVAELQEKIVSAQTKNLTLETEVIKANDRIKELTESLETSNKQMNKLKAQFKTKLKALEEERDLLRKDAESNEELNRLRERIADLEDEKEAGNLLKERIAEMEEKLSRQESDLDSHVKAITLLEAEKLDLVEATKKRNAQFKEKEDVIETLQNQIAQIEETKIAAEMKCLELEEKLDHFMKVDSGNITIQRELEEANMKLQEYQETINDLNLKLLSRETMLQAETFRETESSQSLRTVHDVSSDLLEVEKRCSALEEKLNSTLTYCQELEFKKTSIENENKKLLNECEEFKNVVDNLNGALVTMTQSSDNSDKFQQALAQKDLEITNLNNHNKTLEIEVDNLRHSLQSTTEELHNVYQQLEDLRCTHNKLEELNASLQNKDKELVSVASELNEKTRKLSEYKKFHKLKCEDVIKISQELEIVTSASQEKIAELETALSAAHKNEESLKKEIQDLKDNASLEPDSVESKLQAQSQKMKKLAANIKLKTKLVKDLEAKIEELEKSLQDKDVIINSLEIEKANIQKQLVENRLVNDTSSPNLNELEAKYKQLEVENNLLKEDIKTKTEEILCLNSTSGNYETQVQIKELENQNKKLNDISETKSEQLKKLEGELSDLSGMNKSLMSELDQMQNIYRQDALRNESALNSFEHEMLDNKKELSELSNQLVDVTIKYEQAWAKLQEKEVYIEDLEQQLDKVRSRLLQIESTVEDRRRSLEAKAEMLGERLCQAEKSNEQLEKHEGELEQKILHMLNTEEVIGNILQKLKEENIELSKSLGESVDKNIQLSQQLEEENLKVQNLTKEIDVIQKNLIDYDKMAEDYVLIKKSLKETREGRDHQIRSLESRLSEVEQSTEMEMKRLLDKITMQEKEIQEVNEKYSLLLNEKQMLEEELSSLQQTISDLTHEDLQELKKNHETLTDRLTKEFEKRKEYINRIQDLESQIQAQNSSYNEPSIDYKQEVLLLTQKLQGEIKENEKLKYDLIKERAKQQVEDVVCKAEETYFTMSAPSDEKVQKDVSFFTSLGSNISSGISDSFQMQSFDNNESLISDLRNKLSSLTSENNNLKSRMEELESRCRNISEPSGSNLLESDEWAAVSKDEDDGWGWGSKDALLEHEYSQKQKVHSDLEIKVKDLESKLCSCEEVNKRLLEELKAAQTKCSKLVKKVKEFKVKSESLERNSRERSVGFEDLDFAMQEELRSEIQKLEKSLKDCSSNLNTLHVERDGFLKRIDLLTSANEKLIEMKERQDIEVEMWQKRSNELQHQVQGLEWTIAELNAEQVGSKESLSNTAFTAEEKQYFLSNALEMEEKLNALAAENDYLQSLIVELKDRGKTSSVPSVEKTKTEKENATQTTTNLNEQLKQENCNLFETIKDLEEKLKFGSTASLDETVKYNELKIKNDDLSSELAKVNGKYKELKEKFEILQNERQRLKNVVEPDTGVQPANTCNSSTTPTLFRGFTSSSSAPFNIKPDNNDVSCIETEIPESLLDINTSSASFEQSSFFDTIGKQSKPSTLFTEEDNQQTKSIPLHDQGIMKVEINAGDMLAMENLQSLLNERDSEIVSLKDRVNILQEESIYIRNKADESFEDTLFQPWGSGTNDKKSQRKHLFGEESNIDNDFKDVFSPSSSHESQINHFVEQITKLSNTVQEKETEIEMLTDKEKKYKEMYLRLVNQYEVQSEDQKDVEKKELSDLDTILYQLLEDKETELEFMTQQIDQSKVAKENLQDELSRKLTEMEAVSNTYQISSLEKDTFLMQSQPENIEEVKTLCAEVAELTKLLQEKEVEVEILKQHLDEANLEKENLLEACQKEVETYKAQLSEFGNMTEEEIQMKDLKDNITADIEKQFKEELSLKEQQLMNAMNDLHSTRKFCQDIQTKLNDLQENLQSSIHQNNILTTELNSSKQAQLFIEELINQFGVECDVNVSDNIQKLKDHLSMITYKINELKEEIEGRDKIISDLQEKMKLGTTDEKDESERFSSQSRMKMYTSEPFRTSTEQSSSDDDSSSRMMDSSHSEMMMNEIQTLKQVLSMKDAEITRLSIALNTAQESLIRGEARTEEDSLRHRLDEALYTLHLRDVRCDELTLELMQLLEERDSLQLRLSNAIRFTEELRAKSQLQDEEAVRLEREASGPSPSPPTTTPDQLKQKLDQLHNVGYRNDPGLQQDQKKRHDEHMHLYTHQPPQEENQQSSGFFNWIFGGSSSGSQDV